MIRDPRIAVDAAGDVYVTGTFTNQVAFGAINLISNGDTDVFVAKLHGNDGTVAWAVSIGSATTDRANEHRGRRRWPRRVLGLDGRLPDRGGRRADRELRHCQRHVALAQDESPRPVPTAARPSPSAATAMSMRIVNIGGAYDFGVPIIGASSPSAVVLRIAP